jgi:hypothetical protein
LMPEVNAMFALWLIALLTCVVLLVIVALLAPRGPQEDRPKQPARGMPHQRAKAPPKAA